MSFYLSFPFYSGLSIGRPNSTSRNEISGKRIVMEVWEERSRDRKRDRLKGSGNRGTSYMISLESLKWSISCNARDHWSAARYLADKVAQSCVHYEIRGAEGYVKREMSRWTRQWMISTSGNSHLVSRPFVVELSFSVIVVMRRTGRWRVISCCYHQTYKRNLV